MDPRLRQIFIVALYVFIIIWVAYQESTLTSTVALKGDFSLGIKFHLITYVTKFDYKDLSIFK